MHDWKEHFTERELKEIEFCQVYSQDFRHGTDGHNAKIIIAKLVTCISHLEHEASVAESRPAMGPDGKPLEVDAADHLAALADLQRRRAEAQLAELQKHFAKGLQ